jgi:uncharacterized protein YbjT (DUF2867 family)
VRHDEYHPIQIAPFREFFRSRCDCQSKRAVKAYGEAARSLRAMRNLAKQRFMSNALYWARSIKAEGVVRAATGDGRIPFIHPNDIAGVVMEALIDPQYAGASLPITGPAALSYAEMGAKIGAAIGKPVRFQALSGEQARAQQIAWKAPEPLVEARLSIFRAIREGRLAVVTDVVERVLGRKPIPFDQWARENVGAFR